VQEQSFPGSHPALNQPIDELALAEIKSAILTKLRLAIGKDAGMATKRDWYKAAALALRDRIVHRWLMAEKQSYDEGRKRVYYLSLEFLIGRLRRTDSTRTGKMACSDQGFRRQSGLKNTYWTSPLCCATSASNMRLPPATIR